MLLTPVTEGNKAIVNDSKNKVTNLRVATCLIDK